MSEAYFDEYEHYNYDQDKYVFSGHSGKNRTKREANENTNHFDPSGHSRKLLTKFMNTNNNKKLVTAGGKNWDTTAAVSTTTTTPMQYQQQQHTKKRRKKLK